MFKLPYLREIHQHNLAVDFDMCAAGDLKDAINGKHIRKGMTVVTRSNRVADSLKNKKYMGNNEHQVIEGSTMKDNQRVYRSVFSESYLRKFARSMAKVLCKFSHPKEEPIATIMFAHDAVACVNQPALTQVDHSGQAETCQVIGNDRRHASETTETEW